MIQSSEVEQILAQHTARLRVCLQHASGDSEGPEEGSDAWLLLQALIGNDSPYALGRDKSGPYAALIGNDIPPTSGRDKSGPYARFEQSGRWLAEQGGKLDVRLQGLRSPGGIAHRSHVPLVSLAI